MSRLQEHAREHGSYPADLASLGLELPPSDYGTWRYDVSDERDACWLSIGDYREDLFEYSWSSATGEWSIDT